METSRIVNLDQRSTLTFGQTLCIKPNFMCRAMAGKWSSYATGCCEVQVPANLLMALFKYDSIDGVAHFPATCFIEFGLAAASKKLGDLGSGISLLNMQVLDPFELHQGSVLMCEVKQSRGISFCAANSSAGSDQSRSDCIP